MLGILLTLSGFAFVANSLSGITGYSIINEIGAGESSIYGIIIIFGGLVLFISGIKRKIVTSKKRTSKKKNSKKKLSKK